MTGREHEQEPERKVWLVERPSAFATHWSDPPNSYGPFLPEAGDNDDGYKAAQRFVERMGGGYIVETKHASW